jgi:integrase/recombinase XerD
MLTAARESHSQCDFALVAMLGPLGLRFLEATGANIEDLSEEHGHRCSGYAPRAAKVVLAPLPPASGGRSTAPSAAG